MKVLLVGEYSRLHNTLKEGLIALGHEVTLIGDGDGFKNFPVDLSIRATFVEKPLILFFRKVWFRIFKKDLAEIERGFRFFYHSNKLKDFDVVQLINERPIKTTATIELYLLKQLFKNHKKVFLLSCGADTFTAKYLINNPSIHSILTPYRANKKLFPHFKYIFDYLKPKHQKIHTFLLNHVKGIIASDFDYVPALKGHPKFKGLIPNPINIKAIDSKKSNKIKGPILLFLGINRGNYFAKGIPLFEKAIALLKETIPEEKLKIMISENLPYQTYIKMRNKAHILLDQVYSYDQGYNALEAMARGQVVFTGAGKDFLDFYGLEENQVCIDAIPNASFLVSKITDLVHHHSEIKRIGNNAKKFIKKHHDHLWVATQYLNCYNASTS